MRIPYLLLAAAGLLQAAGGDARFNGRWDIRPASWLEITGADTDSPAGKFVSAFNGDMNVIEKISIKNGELRFGWPSHKIEYRARLVGDKLEGTSKGKGRRTEKWTGVRAPEITEKDDGSWKEGTPVVLFDGKDLEGWGGVNSAAPSGWSVKDGSLVTTGHAANLVSKDKFWNFKLHVEYKMMPHSNSGIGLRGRYEVQVLDDYGRAPNTHSNGALYSRIPPAVNASKPAGEWQTYDIRLVGRDVTIILNDKTLIEKGVIEGLTAIAADANEAEPGGLVLQGDHGPVEYRNIVVTPLVK